MAWEIPEFLTGKLREFVDNLVKEIDPEFIVLYKFGETNKGKAIESLLVLVVSEKFHKYNAKERTNIVKKHWNPPPNLDVYPHTILEFKKLLKRYQGYIYEAIEHGKILYDKGIFQKVRDAVLERLKEVRIDENTLWELY
ncbi:MAG: hypothetical protein ACP6IP_04995 [Candidatus Njordarchaeia archaeon]